MLTYFRCDRTTRKTVVDCQIPAAAGFYCHVPSCPAALNLAGRYDTDMADEGVHDDAQPETSTTLNAKVGIVATVAAAIVGAAVLPGNRLVWLIIVIIALTPPVAWWLSSKVRRWRHWRGVGPWLLTISILASGVALIEILHHISGNNTSASVNGPPPQAYEDGPIIITPPADPDHVGECLALSLSGQVPAGEELVVANQQQGSDQRYFKPVSPGTDDSSWSVTIALGTKLMPSNVKTQAYTIYATLMTKWIVDYLSTMQQYQSSTNTFWVSSQWPPSALQVGQMAVVRSVRVGPASCPP
jgi:hypothetical protein